MSPALIIIGEVIKYRKVMAWHEKNPLAGLRIAVTRPKERAGALLKLLRDAGAEAVNLPVIKTQARECPEFSSTIAELCDKKGVAVFTSSFGVEVFFDNLSKAKIDIRVLSGVEFAAIGQATNGALNARGIRTDLMPEHYSIESLTELLLNKVPEGRELFLFRSAIGSKKINAALEKSGLVVHDIALYDTVPIKTHPVFYMDAEKQNQLLSSFDMFIFCSRSTVESFIETFGIAQLKKSKVISIGEDTRSALQKHEVPSAAAKNATVEELFRTVVEGAGNRDIISKLL